MEQMELVGKGIKPGTQIQPELRAGAAADHIRIKVHGFVEWIRWRKAIDGANGFSSEPVWARLFAPTDNQTHIG
jgi:hypothetical protein